jgi:hypothetical protein
VLLDNTYCCSILSADGHQWADSALATDYVEREFAGWPRSYPAAVLARKGGMRWPIRRRVSSGMTRSRTEKRFVILASSPARKALERCRAQNKISFLDTYHDFLNGSNAIVIPANRTLKRCGPSS